MTDIPDYRAAQRYAIERLARELDPQLCYHNVGHTRDDVLPAVDRLAVQEHLPADELLLVRTAALFHDLGFLVQRAEHETHSVQIARQALPGFGYTDEQIARIGALIMATRLPQSPQSLAAQILADADLDVCGRTDFLARNRALRDELQAFGTMLTDDAWYTGQIAFLVDHRYWTASARWLRDVQKAHNIAALRAALAGVDTT